MRTAHKTILQFSDYLFWDVDKANLDIDKHKSQIIHKVLEYGSMADFNLIKKVYGTEIIKSVSLNFRSLDPVTLAFISFWLKVDKTQFRCYKHKQLSPNYWNS